MCGVPYIIYSLGTIQRVLLLLVLSTKMLKFKMIKS